MIATIVTVRLVDEAFGFLRDGTLESWRAELHLDYRQAALVLACAAPGAIGGNVLAVAADHTSRRVVATVGGLVFAASLLVFGLGHSELTLLAGSFAFGVGSTGLVDGLEVALADLVDDDLGPLIARTNLLGSVGDLLGPALVATASALGWSWRVPFVTCGVVLAVYSLWVACLPLPAPVRAAAAPGGRGSVRRDTFEILRDSRVWQLGVVALLFVLLDETILAFMIAFVHRVHHTTLTTATIVGGATIVGSLGGFALAARAPSRGGRSDRTRLRRGAIAMVATTAAIAFAPGVAGVSVAGLGFGVAAATFWATVQTMTLQLRPGRAGTVGAVVSTIEFSGFGLSIAIGAIADHFGLRTAMAVFVGVPVLLLALVSRGPLWKPRPGSVTS